MAAAIIPVGLAVAEAVATAIPLLDPFAKEIVGLVHGLFSKEDNAAKSVVAQAAVGAAADQLSAGGKIKGVLNPTDIASIVESAYQWAKANRLLPAPGSLLNPASPPAATSNSAGGTIADLLKVLAPGGIKLNVTLA